MLIQEDRKVEKNTNVGIVKIADDVICIIAGLAATEVDGVASMAGNITKDMLSKLGMKNLSKGVKIDVSEGSVAIDLALNIAYGYNVQSVSVKVQEKVKSTVENMTGFTVSKVNVGIAGVIV